MSTEKNNHPIIKPTFRWVFSSPSRILAFGFGSGLAPIAPGTVGTVLAWASFLIAQYYLTTEAILWVIAFGTVLGSWLCGKVSEELGKQDFGGIVWDEIIAFWLVLALVMPTGIALQILSFALFRFFDAVKPGPIGMIDRHFKKMEGSNDPSPSGFKQMLWRGFGIIADDLAAALITVILVVLVQTMLILY
jgi:phosphatidylglycerophosphatase A